MNDCQQSAQLAKEASVFLAQTPTDVKNNILKNIAQALRDRAADIFTANKLDLAEAAKNKIDDALQRRLKFDEEKLADAIKGLESLAGLPEPLGEILEARELDTGLELFRVSCPIGLIGIIFESRPDALVQIASLCLKSGNAVLLKGGREAAHSNAILFAIIKEMSAASLAREASDWIALLETRDEVTQMLKLDQFIDLIIPRGSNEFVRYIIENSSIPVMGHADGICHVYIDADADTAMAVAIAIDSKTQYVSACNAAETYLVHADAAQKILPALNEACQRAGVEVRGCENTQRIIKCAAASEADWRTEYLDKIVSIKIVASLQEAMAHINKYGSHHTEAIVTQSKGRAVEFMRGVNSANVFWNASTRFADGYRYGLGAEVGISTAKLHARGPVGISGLLSYQWRLFGSGQTVAQYSGANARSYTHKNIARGSN